MLKRAGKVLQRFTPGRTTQSKFAGALPIDRGRFLQTRFGSVTRDHFRLALGYFRKDFLDRLRDARMQIAARTAQQCAIGSILQQPMLEQKARSRRFATLEKEAGFDQPAESIVELLLGSARRQWR